jgi:excisionase family DNA binding protein
MNNPFESIEARLSNIENLLLDLKHAPKDIKSELDTAGNELMTVHQCAEFLSLAVPTIYSMVSRGQLPFMKRSKRIYFSRSELMDYLKEGRKQTTEVFANAGNCALKRKRRSTTPVASA